MGVLEVSQDEFIAEHGDIVDIGLSIYRGEDSQLVVKKTEHSYWYVVYHVDRKSFWEIMEEEICGVNLPCLLLAT